MVEERHSDFQRMGHLHAVAEETEDVDRHLCNPVFLEAVDQRLCRIGRVEKAVLRDAGRGIIPEDLRIRRKQGFMITSDPIDFFGADREATAELRRYLSKEAFERGQVFSYRTYRMLSRLARIPPSSPFAFARRLRREANKVLMYIMQVHMLHAMFIADPRWAKPLPRRAEKTKPERSPVAA